MRFLFPFFLSPSLAGGGLANFLIRSASWSSLSLAAAATGGGDPGLLSSQHQNQNAQSKLARVAAGGMRDSNGGGAGRLHRGDSEYCVHSIRMSPSGTRQAALETSNEKSLDNRMCAHGASCVLSMTPLIDVCVHLRLLFPLLTEFSSVVWASGRALTLP